jgi:membrane-associated phospholipid phosphatase
VTSLRRTFVAVMAAGLATVLAIALDPVTWAHLRYPSVYNHDWGRLLRVMGSLVLWIPLALAIWLEQRRREPQLARMSWRILAAPVVAGAVAELLKIAVRRERPDLHDGGYFFRRLAERPFDTHDLGFPSSHAAVAFAGAAVLARLYPRAGAVAYLLALGCAASRVLAQAHFASDVVAGGIAGWAIGAWLGRPLSPQAIPRTL